MDNTELVCWNCLKRTPSGICKHCGVELSNPDEAFEEKKEPEHKRIFRIPRKNQDDAEIDLEEVTALVESSFTIKRIAYSSVPAFLVEGPVSELEQRFETLLQDSENLVLGFKPMLERDKKSDNIIIRFIYNEPPQPAEFRTVFLLGVFTVISVFLAGIFNSSQLQTALAGEAVDNSNVFSLILNIDVLIYSVVFGLVLVVLIGLKDIIQLKSLFSTEKNYLTLFYVPAPPIFELGTFGSIFNQDRFHKNRNHMFSSTFFGPVVAWLSSVVLIFISLPLSIYNPKAASLYSNHSITANGEIEPIMLSLLVRLSNTLGLTSFDLSEPFTSLYILHPLTAGAIGAFYIVSFALFPVAHLNGGFIIRSVYGKRGHLIFTYSTIIAVYFVNWILAIFLFFIHELLKTPEILNEEAELNPSYKWLMVPFFLIILLSYPFDHFIINWIF